MTIHVLGEVKIGDLAQFLEIFGTEGLDKREAHGCQGSTVFTTPGQDGRVTVLLEFPDQTSFTGSATTKRRQRSCERVAPKDHPSSPSSTRSPRSSTSERQMLGGQTSTPQPDCRTAPPGGMPSRRRAERSGAR